MPVPFDDVAYNRLRVKLPVDSGSLGKMTDEKHEELLRYLLCRLDLASVGRSSRLSRYARVDRLISTWQKLSKGDSKRQALEDNTGRSQAMAINLPLMASHLEDTQAFFAEIFSASSRDFYSVSPEDTSEAAKKLADRMNQDARARKYYKELCLGIRSLIKYNVGGYAVRWEEGGGDAELAKPGNRIESIDMWNYLWDPSVIDVSRISADAEFAARITVKSRMWLQKQAVSGRLQRIRNVFEEATENEQNPAVTEASYYREPPTNVNLTLDGQDQESTSSEVNWEAYGASLGSEKLVTIPGFEVIEMFCWVNPKQLELHATEDSIQLWRFIIVAGKQVCFASPVDSSENADKPSEIPHYLGHMTQDDMKEAQRSIMELMKGFQRFTSFLVNIIVAGARKNIWGTKGFDPSMFDISESDKGDVAHWLVSKQPGRDVRTGLMTLDSNPGTDKAIEILDATLSLVQRFFPSQALPQQVAGIDRAVKDQVAAVMQGAVRRLHMTARLIDSDIMGPMRLQAYRNIAEFDGADLSGLDDESVAAVLGSGLKQLDAEATAAQVKEIIFAILQNPESASFFDIVKLMTFWSRTLNSPSDLGSFVKQQASTPSQQGADQGAGAPDVMSAAGLEGGPAPVAGLV